MTTKPLAATFLDDQSNVTVEILSVSSSTSLCKCRTEDGKVIARHKARLTPLNDAAKDLLKRK